MATKIQSGASAAGLADVNANFQLEVTTQVDALNNTQYVGGVKVYSEVDSGEFTNEYDLRSAEVDADYRMRVAMDNLLDYDSLKFTAQNTGKHTFTFTTLAATITAAGLTTNSGSITTINTGLTFGTHAMFSIHPTQTMVCETSVSFTSQPVANTLVDFGMFQRGATAAFAPLDGVYFRLTSAGLFGVINSNGSEVTTTVFPFAYTNNQNYRFLIQTNNVRTTFWVLIGKDMELLGSILTPVGLEMPFLSECLPWSFRHAIVGGAAGGVFQAIFTDYKISQRGGAYSDSLGDVAARMNGTYQGVSGNTMGQLIAGTVTSGTLVKPTAAVPANTSLVANLPNSLGGRIYEQLSTGLAANVDGIFASYQNPIGSATVQGKRLKVSGIMLSGFVSTVVVGGGAVTEWYIAFGHTAASLATAESASMTSATTKAPRRVMLPTLTAYMSAAQAAGTILQQAGTYVAFEEPIWINQGEFIALVGNKTITSAITSGVLSYTYQFIYTQV